MRDPVYQPHSNGRSGHAFLAAITAFVLLVQIAPSATGLLAGLAHATFHLSSRTGLEQLESRGRPGFEPSDLVHSHGPHGEPHSHAPAVDRALEVAYSADGAHVAPTGFEDRVTDRFLGPETMTASDLRAKQRADVPAPAVHPAPPLLAPPVPPPQG